MTKLALPVCLQSAKKIELPKNTKVFQAGDTCEMFYFLERGTIRVDLMTRTGKPVTLYRFGSGETCILTTSCLLSGDIYNAEAITEDTVEARALPLAQFQLLLESSSDFRRLVFTSFATRLSAMMTKIEEVTSFSIDQRLAKRALELREEQHPIDITHDQLAADLGTAREVVSRRLARWQSNGWIERKRGGFSILDEQILKQLANPET